MFKLKQISALAIKPEIRIILDMGAVSFFFWRLGKWAQGFSSSKYKIQAQDVTHYH
jgi:hypothetical protein